MSILTDAIRRGVNGWVTIMVIDEVKYTFPPFSEDVNWSGSKKHKSYCQRAHLIAEAQKALEHNHLRIYTWVMEEIVSLPCVKLKLGVTALIDAVPFIGSLIVFIMNFTVYLSTTKNVYAPSWLLQEILHPLLCATGLAFFFPEVGDAAASSIRPSRTAATKVKYLLELRQIISIAMSKDPRNKNINCEQLTRHFGGGEWKFSDRFCREVLGEDPKNWRQDHAQEKGRRIQDVEGMV
ncbi:uncharacterized protein L203_102949 [Cryptococcus depauperatus CBS 7841]|uniref:Uncharacterized protein n=1 Tax=Cryptococcus depauperatus CBS 7841 TaxID=1295531 RepID=A0AAJ8JSX0_9TREE